VIAVVPARNEADVIERSMGSLLDQDYPGRFQVVLVDDSSEDGTGDLARRLQAAHPNGARLTVVVGAPLPPGWVGKMWAVHNGIRRADALDPNASYLWLTDADIAHAPGVLRGLVAKAEGDGLDLVSLMALLHCTRPWERLLIPAFVFFFQKLYPFPRVNDPGDKLAGAAGGCMLVRRDALAAIGGIETIRSAVIDDCSLGRALKARGPIWLGLTEETRSIRPYEGLRDIWRMVARSAYDQLYYSPLYLLGTVIGMAIIYLAPPLIALSTPLHGSIAAGLTAAAAWLLMAWSYRPTLALYRRFRSHRHSRGTSHAAQDRHPDGGSARGGGLRHWSADHWQGAGAEQLRVRRAHRRHECRRRGAQVRGRGLPERARPQEGLRQLLARHRDAQWNRYRRGPVPGGHDHAGNQLIDSWQDAAPGRRRDLLSCGNI
jgi:hopene-associated glycosyltransferase HpnB